MILLIANLFLIQSIDFYVDPVVYLSKVMIEDTITHNVKQEDIFYIEFNCEIPYHDLHYEESDSGIKTRAVIPFEIVNLDKADTLADTLYRSFTLPSFSEAARQQMSFIVQFGLHVLEGRYKYRINVISSDKTGAVEEQLIITKADYRMSDILCAKEIVVDTIGDYLKKGSLKVVPLPSRKFSEQYSKLYLYYEIYNIDPDPLDMQIKYVITDSLGQIVQDISQKVTKKYTSQAVNVGLNIAKFTTGQYGLKVSIYDPTTDSTVEKNVTFEITKKVSDKVNDLGLPYYQDIEYFLTPEAFKKYKELPQGGKEIFLQKFWSQYDYEEIAGRFAYADEHLSEGHKTGSRTDRGRIYIKFGPYDQLITSVIERQESRPYEMWEYENGLRFVFVDIRRTNEFTLVWTNAATEKSEPTLFEYLPESLKEELPSGAFN